MKKRRPVTDVTALPYVRAGQIRHDRNAGNIGYMPPARVPSIRLDYPPLSWIKSAEELAAALGATSSAEGELLGVPEREAIKERQQALASGVPADWFLRKWRALNAVSVASYCRLNGSQPSEVWRALREGEIRGLLEPLTGRLFLPLWMPLAQGFSYDEVQRAAAGERIYLTRQLQGATGDRS